MPPGWPRRADIADRWRSVRSATSPRGVAHAAAAPMKIGSPDAETRHTPRLSPRISPTDVVLAFAPGLDAGVPPPP